MLRDWILECNMPFSLFLALKYLKPKRTLTSVVTVISVVGVLLGVAILLIVMSVMTGFDNMWREKILAFKPHLVVTRVSPATGRGGILDQPDQLCDRIEAMDGVVASTPSVETKVLMSYNDRTSAPMVIGVDPERVTHANLVASNIVSGVFDVEDDGIVMGRDLAHELGALVGDRVLLYSPLNVVSMDEMYLPEEVVVRGLFNMGMRDFDSMVVLSSLGIARELVGIEEGAYSVHVSVKEPMKPVAFAKQAWEMRAMLAFDEEQFLESLTGRLGVDPDTLAERVEQHLKRDMDGFSECVRRGVLSQPYDRWLGARSMLPITVEQYRDELMRSFGLNYENYTARVEEGVGLTTNVLMDIIYPAGRLRGETPVDTSYRVSTWQEVDEMMFRALTHEKNMMFILLGAITVVAVFCVTNTLIVITVQKTNEIGLLKALGFSSGQIMATFVWVGWIQCLIGTVLGIGTGLLVLVNLNNIVAMLAKFGTEVFPKDIYGLEGIPWDFNGSDVFFIAACVMGFCTIAALYPAWRASRMDPVVALRHE